MKVAKQILISFKGADRRRKGNGNLRGSVCNMWPKGIHYHLALPRGDWLFCGQYHKQNNKLYWTLVLLCILVPASNLVSPAWLGSQTLYCIDRSLVSWQVDPSFNTSFVDTLLKMCKLSLHWLWLGQPPLQLLMDNTPCDVWPDLKDLSKI